MEIAFYDNWEIFSLKSARLSREVELLVCNVVMSFTGIYLTYRLLLLSIFLLARCQRLRALSWLLELVPSAQSCAWKPVVVQGAAPWVTAMGPGATLVTTAGHRVQQGLGTPWGRESSPGRAARGSE